MSQRGFLFVEHCRPMPAIWEFLPPGLTATLMTGARTEAPPGIDRLIPFGKTPPQSPFLESPPAGLEVLQPPDWKWEGVYAIHDESLIHAEQLASWLGLRSDGLQPLLRIRNKYLMRQTLARHENHVVDFDLVQGPNDIARFVRRRGAAVLKPLAGMGSVVTQPVSSGDNFQSTYAKLTSTAQRLRDSHVFGLLFERCHYADAGILDPCTQFLIEERLYGPELSVECVVSGGVLSILMVHEVPQKGANLRDQHFVGPAKLDTETKDRIANTLQSALSLLGVENRALCCEFILTEQGPRLLEVNGRPGGMGTVQSVYWATGLQLHELAMRIARGEQVREQPPKAPCFCAFAPFYSMRAGVFSGVQGPLVNSHAEDGATHLEVFHGLNDLLTAKDRDITPVGSICCTAQSRESALLALRHALDMTEVNVIPA